MAEETSSGSVRITQAQIYEKLLEVQSVQIEIVADLKNLKDLPARMNRVEQKLARMEWIEKLVFTALGSGITGFIAALWALIR
jgi:hypothetical protein